MPWTGPQLALLRELGVPWAPLLPRAPVQAVPPADADLPPERPAEGALPAERPAAAVRPVERPKGTAPRVERAVDGVVAQRVTPASAATSAQALPVAGLDWTALRAAVAACEACTLCRTRTQTVFGVGSTRAHWMVVGEAPGEQEDLKGEPFVGAAGRLLDAMLHALGLTRAEPGGDDAADEARRVYIANTLKCRPPRNRNPQPDELARCEPFLLRQIELLKPRIVVAMGRFAVQSLLRSSEPIGRLRGRVHRYHGVPLVVTYHPAYLLRNPADKAKAWADLCLAAATYESAAPNPPSG